MTDEITLMKEQMKNLEATVKTLDNHILFMQGEFQFTLKALQLEQGKLSNQVGALVSFILDTAKDNRHYEENREAQLLQKLTSIMNMSDDYNTLNNALSGTNTSMSTDANSLINGTIASLTNSGAGTANTTAILPSSSSRMGSNDQLLTASSIQQSQNQLLSQSHNQSQQSQLQQLQQQAQMNAVQKNFQQMQQQQQQQHTQSRMQQQQQQLQQQQQHRQHKTQGRQQSLSHHLGLQQQHQSQNNSVEQDNVTVTPASKRRKTNSNRQRNSVPTTDPSSILDDTLTVNVGSSRHVVPIALSPNSEAAEKDKVPKKVYDKEYAFIKAPTSVEEIWNEYAIGLNGQPSIKSLEVEYKTGWRRDPATSKKFNRRKAIYHAIEKGISKGFSTEVCIRLLEDYRYLDRGKNLKQPIGWLCHGNVPAELR